jgi:predicted GIY-YIG superfamily endonuclease
MRRAYQFFVYIMSSQWRTIYVGVTNDLAREADQRLETIQEGGVDRFDQSAVEGPRGLVVRDPSFRSG